MTPEERVLRAKLAAHARWSQADDRTKQTSAARAAFEDRFLAEVDPNNTLAPEERAKRAQSARKAYYARLALQSSIARRKKRAADNPSNAVRNTT